MDTAFRLGKQRGEAINVSGVEAKLEAWDDKPRTRELPDLYTKVKVSDYLSEMLPRPEESVDFETARSLLAFFTLRVQPASLRWRSSSSS